MNISLSRRVVLLALCFGPAAVAPAAPSTFVDSEGVWRWSETHAELALFGVNYTTPFAHAFRAHRRLGVDWRTAIDADVYHFARLGFDAYRVHVWDREISDAEGNLLVNEHVEALDYLLAKLKQRGIKSVLTPLQFGNAGYPEPGEPLIGFSSKYGKRGCLEDRESWPLQERYLGQFMNHVNPHTGLAYANDPDVVAVEICNEPGHFDHALTVEYINTMVRAVRRTGFANPIFYNMSHGLPVFAAYLQADVQGGTFQWYPSNLVAGHEQRGNFLSYVDDYPIPFGAHPGFRNKARLVYEFDAADIGRSYIYPAIARTFRTNGFQFAAQFAYDPLHLAPFNTEYQTHYLNLAYTPSKALALKIAAAAFRRLPRGQDFGRYPENTKFEAVRIDYPSDLAELITDERFFYSNNTSSTPHAPERLQQIAGYGDSSVVQYAGHGVYFLDRIERGVWRLEVMPDAVPVGDPFAKPSPAKQVVHIAWNDWPVRIVLPDLGPAYAVKGLNPGNTLAATAADGRFQVRPGVYLLTRAQVKTGVIGATRARAFGLDEFVAPAPSVDRVYVVHEPSRQVTAGRPLSLTATVAGPTPPDSVELIVQFPVDPIAEDRARRPNPAAQPGGGNTPGVGATNPGGSRSFVMRPVSGLRYAVELPAAELRTGTLRYHISVRTGGDVTTFPSLARSHPTDWHFTGDPWESTVVAPTAPVLIFAAAEDSAAITADDRDVRYDNVPSDRPGIPALRIATSNLDVREHDFSLRFFFREKVAPRHDLVRSARRLVIYAKSATERSGPLQVALVTQSGNAYGAVVTLTPTFAPHAIELARLKPVRTPNLPHGYPSFIAFWSPARAEVAFDPRDAESILFSVGPGIPAAEFSRRHGADIERAWLE